MMIPISKVDLILLLCAVSAILYARSCKLSHIEVDEYPHQWLGLRQDGAPLWCGKAYNPEYRAIDPGGRVRQPPKSAETIIDFQCYTQMNVYFHGEETAQIIFELRKAEVVYDRALGDAHHIAASDAAELQIGLGVQQQHLTLRQDIEYFNFTVGLSEFHPSHDAHLLSCSLSSGQKSIMRKAEIYHLPHRTNVRSSLSKLDRVTGMVMINSTTGGTSLEDWTPFYPYGYYGQPRDLTDLSKQGFNILHHVPDISTAPNTGYPEDYIDQLREAADLGIWVMHDMRWTWQNTTLLQDQLERIKDVPNLLTWYTGDEPDGLTADPQSFYSSTRMVREIDSRYHVLSTALNCADFYFEEYSRDIDVVLSDPYPVGLFSADTHRSIYSTPCNLTYGCCGCDNCPTSSVLDVVARLDRVRAHAAILGRKPGVWIIPQGFGSSEHWPSSPNPDEELAIQVIALGVTQGAVVWNYQPEVDEADINAQVSHSQKKVVLALRAVTSHMARLLSTIQHILIHYDEFTRSAADVTTLHLYHATWSNSTHILVAFVNPGLSMNRDYQIRLSAIGKSLHSVSSVVQVAGDVAFRVSDGRLHVVAVDKVCASLWLIGRAR